MQEEWKKVPYADRYSVSDQGRVRNDETRRILKLIPASRDYLIVNLVNGMTKKTYYVHRLIGELFLDNPDGLHEVRHLNGDKTDNSVGNLKWMRHHNHDFCKPTVVTFPSGNVVRYESRVNASKALGTYTRKIRKALASGDTLRGVSLTAVEKVKPSIR